MWEEHLQHVQAALKLTVRVKKCKFAQREVSFLGHTVGGGKLKTQEAKVKTILDLLQRRSYKASSTLLDIIENLWKDIQPLLPCLTSPGRSYLKS